MSDYVSMSTDELHKLLDETYTFYEMAKGNDWETEAGLVKELGVISNELRARHEMWIKLPDHVLLKRYSMGMIVSPIDTVMDEWQEEIERRGLTLPEKWHDESEAYYYFYDEEADRAE